jgi:hypothetical protein
MQKVNAGQKKFRVRPKGSDGYNPRYTEVSPQSESAKDAQEWKCCCIRTGEIDEAHGHVVL